MAEKLKHIVFIVLAVFFTQSVLYAQKVEEILGKHIEAMGGKEKLSALKSVKISSVISVMGMEMNMNTVVIHQKALRSETEVQGMKIIQAIDNGKGWQINPMLGTNAAADLTNEEIKAISSQLDLTGFMDYEKKGYKVKLDGEENLNGAAVYVISFTTGNGISTVNYISKDTWYVLKSIMKIAIDGQETETTVLPSNYKKVNGIVFPFTSEIKTSAMPGGSMISETKSLEVNSTIDPAIFKKPV